MPTAEQIHSILDRHRAGASPFSGSSLLSARYRDVPLLSSAWAIGHIGLPFSERGYITLFGLQLPLAEDTTFVASLRYVGAIHLRIEQLSPTDADAARSAQSLTAILGLFKSIQQQMQPRNASDKAFLNMIESLKLEQRKDRAIITATIPMELLRELTSSDTEISPASTPNAPASPPPASH